MSVTLQLVGAAIPSAIPKLATVLKERERWFKRAAGFELGEVLVNHPEAKVQFMIQFSTFEEALAFTKEEFHTLRGMFEGIVDEVSPPYFFAVESDIRA